MLYIMYLRFTIACVFRSFIVFIGLPWEREPD